MAHEERHPYTHAAASTVPEVSGIFHLFDREELVWVQWDANVRARLLDLYDRFPEATDFTFKACAPADGQPIAEKLRKAYHLAERVPVQSVRAKAAAAGAAR